MVPPWLIAGVLQRQPAEAHQQIGVLDDDLPLGGALEQVVVGADHPRHDHAGRAEAVGVPGKGVSAKEFEEPMHLALRVVESAGAGPAVGAAVDRLVAVGVDDAAQFVGEQLGELVPRHRDELVGTAPVLGPGPSSQPAAPHGGRGDS